jgi:hypothetical protein
MKYKQLKYWFDLYHAKVLNRTTLIYKIKKWQDSGAQL